MKSAEKQIPSLCKFHAFDEELLEEFLDETDVDSSSYRSFLGNSQSQRRIVRVSKDSLKITFASKLLEFCEVKTQQRYIFQKETNIAKTELKS